MIPVRARAYFRADFPYDGVEDEQGLLLFPGKAIAAAIADLLRRLGCEVSDPRHAHERGWELDIEFNGEPMWCQVTSIEEGEAILLFLESALMGNFSGKPAYLEAIAKLNLAMLDDPRFHDIRWCRWRDAEGPAAAAPLDMGLDRLPRAVPGAAAKKGWFGWLWRGQAQGEPGAIRIRNKAKIEAEGPNHAIYEDEKVVRAGGRGVAAAIGEIMGRLGVDVSAPINLEPGWGLDLHYEGRRARCYIEHIDGVAYLDLDDRLVLDQPAYVEGLVRLNDELHRDPRFRHIRWYRRDDMNMRGLSSDSPVGPTA